MKTRRASAPPSPTKCRAASARAPAWHALESGGTSTRADGSPLIDNVPYGTINLMMRYSPGKCRSVG